MSDSSQHFRGICNLNDEEELSHGYQYVPSCFFTLLYVGLKKELLYSFHNAVLNFTCKL